MMNHSQRNPYEIQRFFILTEYLKLQYLSLSNGKEKRAS